MTVSLPDTAAHESSRHGRSLLAGRLLVFTAIIMSALSLRVAVTSYSPLAERIGDDIGYSLAVVGVFGMIPTAMFAISGLLAPLLSRRLDLERTALAAMLMAGSGMLIRSLLQGTGELLLFSALALGGMGIGNVVLPPLVKRYFPDRIPIVSALYITMVQIGTILPALVAVPAADAFGWRVSVGMWALIGFAAALPWIVMLCRKSGPDHPVATPVQPGGGVDHIWRSPVAWGMALMFGMTSLCTYAIFAWLPRILTDAGASDSYGGTMVALYALIGLASAMVAPSLVARFRNPFPFVLGSTASFLFAFTGLLVAPMEAPVFWVLVLGIGPATFPMALTLINLRTRTPRGSAALSGFTQGIGYALACLGPLLFGILHTATDGWLAPFGLLYLAVGVLLAGGWQACKPRLLEDT